MKNIIWLIVGFVIALLSCLSLIFSWPRIASELLILWLCLCLVSLIIECSLRSFRKKPGRQLIELPDRTWALLLIVFFLSANISSFANLYIKSEGIACQIGCTTPILEDVDDAIYYSVVTLTTLGYGDFVPYNKEARRYVVYQLVSGVLLLLFLFPIVASRLSELDS
jgi:hypothetical protein